MADADGGTLDGDAIVASIGAWARELGFQAAAIARLDLDDDVARLHAWLADQHHGSMDYMATRAALRAAPKDLVPGTLSIVALRMNYLPETLADATACLGDSRRGYVARYALGRDYHKVLRQRLRTLAERLAAHIGPFGYRVFTDSAPVLERALARNAGLGWIGKHTCLIDRDDGSLFFLGEIFTDLPLAPTAVEQRNLCGSCTRCLDVCPTGAIVAPYVVDSRRCISYLTIESKDAIPEALRAAIGNRVFGCDDCQLVCPWNRHAEVSAIGDFAPRHGLDGTALVELFAWSEDEFELRTRGSALRRIDHAQWLRNVAVALGNAPPDPAIAAALAARLDHPSALVREHVAWALDRQQANGTGAAGTCAAE